MSVRFAVCKVLYVKDAPQFFNDNGALDKAVPRFKTMREAYKAAVDIWREGFEVVIYKHHHKKGWFERAFLLSYDLPFEF